MTPPSPTGMTSPTAAPLLAPGPARVVLLVEDEAGVRQLVRRVLEMRGLTVLAVAGPEEALRTAAEYPGRLDVMVADVSLPGMDGRELAAAVRIGRPELKLVFISGYPRDQLFGPGPPDLGTEFLPKPFTPGRLVEMLDRLLAAPPPPPGVNDPASR